MAGQFQVVHSRTVTGAAILAAGPFGCAASPGAEAFPVFAAALAYNLAQAQNSCMANSGSGGDSLDSGRLLQRAEKLAKAGKIDPLADLQRSKTYLFWGSEDRTVSKAVVEAARGFYLAAGVLPANIDLAVKDGAGHAFLTDGKGEACDKSAPPYVNNCHYDEAGSIFRFFYGSLAPRGKAKDENFVTFDQGRYAASAATLADKGIAYVPKACRAAAHCRVHVVFHGCSQAHAEAGDAVTRQTGFADWADTNNIVVLFPQAAPSALNPLSCWDWWGYTGLDFLTRDAPQIKAVEAMLTRLGEMRAH